MVELIRSGAYYTGGALTQEAPSGTSPEEARNRTMAWQILSAHNQSGQEKDLRIRFDKLTSHDITYVGIIQTARASGLVRFPMPYVLTNCHNSLCAVGGTINEDDHMFGLTAAKKYGGVYVPPHLAVIHQYAREMLAEAGGMILGSDSHTRYGALGTMAVGEGGPELVKQLLGQTYDIRRPEVIAIYLTGAPRRGVGPQDVALALIGAVFESGFVKNKVLEFIGPGVVSLSADFRIGVDVMTTETTCLSSIWETDEKTEQFYAIHGRPESYRRLTPGDGAYYDGVVCIELDKVEPMIAMPFHPSNVYPIAEVQKNLKDVLHEVEERAKVSLGAEVPYSLQDKIRAGAFQVEQGIIAGCAGGGFENLCAAADILDGHSVGNDRFSFSVYPASMPIYMEIVRNGVAAKLIESGAVIKTAFCGPCFGAGDTPANNQFSIRHSTRNFPNREGSKLQSGQIASVALMDARSIAATAANGGILTPATAVDADFGVYEYHFDHKIYDHRVFDSKGKADPDQEVQLGPNIKDWPKMAALPEHLLLKLVSEIHDPVTTTDELIPSGETSSYRSNPEGLAQFTLSRKDPAYVGLAKEVRKAQQAILDGSCVGDALPELRPVVHSIKPRFPELVPHDHRDADGNLTAKGNLGIGSAIFAVKPGDGSAREQAASCQKVLGGWANFANEYATKRYRSNLINWGMLPFVIDDAQMQFGKGDYLFFPDIRAAVEQKAEKITGYVVRPEAEDDQVMTPFSVTLGDLTDEERQIILDGCLINYNRRKAGL
ncbi:MAG: hydratase [Lachnospiraceae bacterium]|nr:hydratase [Lachnospiraceae bacterium]